MPVFLHALSLKNYRGIGEITQTMHNFKTFNFFIGANNAGKSTILNFISRHLPPRLRGNWRGPDQTEYVVEELERHEGNKNRPIEMAIGVPVWIALNEFTKKYKDLMANPNYNSKIKSILDWMSNDDFIWKKSNVPYGENLILETPDFKLAAHLMKPNEWYEIWTKLTNMGQGNINAHWIPETIKAVELATSIALPQVSMIPAIREIGRQAGDFEDYNGAGLIDKLAALQAPEFNRQSDRQLFHRINGFLQYVTGVENARIEIPSSREHVVVHMNGRILPLSSLGTGIHEVIMIAAFCTIAQHQIVCIEEPEIHLHPLLQRKLMRFLEDNTNNQYFIATHSSAFIDTPGAGIFHVFQQEGMTHIREASLKKERHSVCVDLGYRASDIVQANAIIWVEGPSDRIYLNHWISAFDNRLREGIHYAIMFYGGRLLSHLAADDNEVSEFIQLRDLNRNVAIIMDSDKRNAQHRLNETKLRLKHELGSHGGLAWVTKGREIENYIDHSRLQRAVKAVYGEKYSAPVDATIYDHSLHFIRTSAKRSRVAGTSTDLVETQVDKVAVSRVVVADGEAGLDILDLRERVAELVELIRHANA